MVWPRKNIFAEYTQAVPPRFYVPEARTEESTIELPEDEALHLTRVLRLTAGDRIHIFNGRGDEWEAEVEETTRHRVSARLQSRINSAPESRIAIDLAIAVLKGEKMDDIVRDAVMLGVASIQPLITARTEVSRAALEKSSRTERWQRIAVASAKQCGRAVVPPVRAAEAFEGVVSRVTDGVMLVEPSARAATTSLQHLSPRQRLTLFVGPEGGWLDQEVLHARDRGAMLLTLGSQTLRADAVPIVALTAIRVRLEDF
jgi:16S rRNA (uracil1498-N3)-methyltransferase